MNGTTPTTPGKSVPPTGSGLPPRPVLGSSAQKTTHSLTEESQIIQHAQHGVVVDSNAAPEVALPNVHENVSGMLENLRQQASEMRTSAETQRKKAFGVLDADEEASKLSPDAPDSAYKQPAIYKNNELNQRMDSLAPADIFGGRPQKDFTHDHTNQGASSQQKGGSHTVVSTVTQPKLSVPASLGQPVPTAGSTPVSLEADRLSTAGKVRAPAGGEPRATSQTSQITTTIIHNAAPQIVEQEPSSLVSDPQRPAVPQEISFRPVGDRPDARLIHSQPGALGSRARAPARQPLPQTPGTALPAQLASRGSTGQMSDGVAPSQPLPIVTGSGNRDISDRSQQLDLGSPQQTVPSDAAGLSPSTPSTASPLNTSTTTTVSQATPGSTPTPPAHAGTPGAPALAPLAVTPQNAQLPSIVDRTHAGDAQKLGGGGYKKLPSQPLPIVTGSGSRHTADRAHELKPSGLNTIPAAVPALTLPAVDTQLPRIAGSGVAPMPGLSSPDTTVDGLPLPVSGRPGDTQAAVTPQSAAPFINSVIKRFKFAQNQANARIIDPKADIDKNLVTKVKDSKLNTPPSSANYNAQDLAPRDRISTLPTEDADTFLKNNDPAMQETHIGQNAGTGYEAAYPTPTAEALNRSQKKRIKEIEEQQQETGLSGVGQVGENESASGDDVVLGPGGTVVGGGGAGVAGAAGVVGIGGEMLAAEGGDGQIGRAGVAGGSNLLDTAERAQNAIEKAKKAGQKISDTAKKTQAIAKAGAKKLAQAARTVKAAGGAVRFLLLFVGSTWWIWLVLLVIILILMMFIVLLMPLMAAGGKQDVLDGVSVGQVSPRSCAASDAELMPSIMRQIVTTGAGETATANEEVRQKLGKIGDGNNRNQSNSARLASLVVEASSNLINNGEQKIDDKNEYEPLESRGLSYPYDRYKPILIVGDETKNRPIVSKEAAQIIQYYLAKEVAKSLPTGVTETSEKEAKSVGDLTGYSFDETKVNIDGFKLNLKWDDQNNKYVSGVVDKDGNDVPNSAAIKKTYADETYVDETDKEKIAIIDPIRGEKRNLLYESSGHPSPDRGSMPLGFEKIPPPPSALVDVPYPISNMNLTEDDIINQTFVSYIKFTLALDINAVNKSVDPVGTVVGWAVSFIIRLISNWLKQYVNLSLEFPVFTNTFYQVENWRRKTMLSLQQFNTNNSTATPVGTKYLAVKDRSNVLGKAMGAALRFFGVEIDSSSNKKSAPKTTTITPDANSSGQKTISADSTNLGNDSDGDNINDQIQALWDEVNAMPEGENKQTAIGNFERWILYGVGPKALKELIRISKLPEGDDKKTQLTAWEKSVSTNTATKSNFIAELIAAVQNFIKKIQDFFQALNDIPKAFSGALEDKPTFTGQTIDDIMAQSMQELRGIDYNRSVQGGVITLEPKININYTVTPTPAITGIEVKPPRIKVNYAKKAISNGPGTQEIVNSVSRIQRAVLLASTDTGEAKAKDPATGKYDKVIGDKTGWKQIEKNRGYEEPLNIANNGAFAFGREQVADYTKQLDDFRTKCAQGDYNVQTDSVYGGVKSKNYTGAGSAQPFDKLNAEDHAKLKKLGLDTQKSYYEALIVNEFASQNVRINQGTAAYKGAGLDAENDKKRKIIAYGLGLANDSTSGFTIFRELDPPKLPDPPSEASQFATFFSTTITDLFKNLLGGVGTINSVGDILPSLGKKILSLAAAVAEQYGPLGHGAVQAGWKVLGTIIKPISTFQIGDIKMKLVGTAETITLGMIDNFNILSNGENLSVFTPDSQDGKVYDGRGFALKKFRGKQIYQKFSTNFLTNEDIVANPNLIAANQKTLTNPALAAFILVRGVLNGDINGTAVNLQNMPTVDTLAKNPDGQQPHIRKFLEEYKQFVSDYTPKLTDDYLEKALQSQQGELPNGKIVGGSNACVTNNFMNNTVGANYLHTGVDINAQSPQDIYAYAEGDIVYARLDQPAGKGAKAGGNIIAIRSANPTHFTEAIVVRYLHLSSDDVLGITERYNANGNPTNPTNLVHVKSGQKIGRTGGSGTEKPHLHFDILEMNEGLSGTIDPMKGTLVNPFRKAAPFLNQAMYPVCTGFTTISRDLTKFDDYDYAGTYLPAVRHTQRSWQHSYGAY